MAKIKRPNTNLEIKSVDELTKVAAANTEANEPTDTDESGTQEEINTSSGVDTSNETGDSDTPNDDSNPSAPESNVEQDKKPKLEDSKEAEVVAPVVTFDRVALNAKLKDSTTPIFTRLEGLISVLPSPANKVVSSLVSLTKLRSKLAEESILNREQKYFTREFKKLLELNQNSFDELMVYVNWAYKELTNVDNMSAAGIHILKNGKTPLEPSNILIYTVNKDDQELFSFVYLMTILDIRATTPDVSDRPVNLSKVTVATGLTDSQLEKINKFYAK